MFTKIFSNITYLIISNVIEKFLLYILFAVMARKLGPDSFGQFFLAFTFCNIFFIFNELGLTSTLIKNVSRNKSESLTYFSNIMGIRIFSTMISCLLIFLLINSLDYAPNIKNLMYILTAYFIFSYLSHPFSGVFRAYEKMKYIFLCTLSDKLLVCLLAVFTLFKGGGINYVAMFFCFGAVSRIILSYFLIKGRILPRVIVSFNFYFWKKMLSESIIIGGFMILVLVFFRIDTLMLSAYGLSYTAIGEYNAAQIILVVLIVPVTSFTQAVFPLLSKLNFNNGTEYKNILSISLYSVFCFSLIFLGVFYAISDLLILFIYGNEYIGAINIFKIFCLSIPFIYISLLLQWILISMDHAKKSLVLVLIAVVVNILSNMFLIPSYGLVGAAWGSFLAQGVTMVFCLLIFIRLIKKNRVSY